MARAAVKAKQAQQAQAHAAANASRKQRKHASGGNPNQDLFFSRLRRRQKWVFIALIIIFAVSFVFLGVGSGAGSGLQDLYSSILGSGNDPVASAKAEIKKDPAKGYKDLASAYQQKGDLTNAIGALQTYVNTNKKDSAAWSQLAQYENSQGQFAYGQYQLISQAAQLESPGSVVTPSGPLATQLGTNPLDEYYSTKNAAISGPLYQAAISGYNAALTDYQNAAKYAKGRIAQAGAWGLVYGAAQTAGNTKAAFESLQKIIQLSPTAPSNAVVKTCKQLAKSLKKDASACARQPAK
ncbi:MAG TPA: hypothetical protein VGH82_15870 [Gaiellaceae bacterium]|jgi:tetratricopeptide (TPR) repeat protein